MLQWGNEQIHNYQSMLPEPPSLTYGALSQIEHQVLITFGEKDKMVSVLESELATSKLKNARLKLFENMRHPLEQKKYSCSKPKLKNSLAKTKFRK